MKSAGRCRGTGFAGMAACPAADAQGAAYASPQDGDGSDQAETAGNIVFRGWVVRGVGKRTSFARRSA